MSVTITKLEPQRTNPDLINLYIDGEFRTAVAFAALNAQQLGTGDVITPEQLEQLLAADECWRAKQTALSFLSVRGRARGELAERLHRKSFSDAAIQYGLAEVERLGLLDDAAFAESWVRDRLRLRPRGTQALVYELGRKRVPPEIAELAVARVMAAENVTDDELCMAAAQRWTKVNARSNEDDALRRERRLSAYLARRGYPSRAVRAAVEAVLGTGGD
jgi:regulatory protein